MKKQLLIAVIALVAAVGAQAQENIMFGAKGGVNFASFSGDDADEVDFDGRTGFHLGLFAEIMITERFSLQPEILYSTMGAKKDNLRIDDGFGNEMVMDAEIKLDYISVPVMVKLYLLRGFSLEAGPQFSFNVNTENEFETEGVRFELEEDAESFEIGAGFGVGYEMLQGILFQARYTMGFADVFDETDFRNNVFQLSVGYKF